MRQMRRLLFFIFLFFVVLFMNLGAGEPRKPATPLLKEKPLPPLGAYYLYITPLTPRYLIEKARAKKWQVAFLFDQRQAAWLRGTIPSLQGTVPLIFVRAPLSLLDEQRLRETLDFFDYEAVIVFIKKEKNDCFPATIPVKGVLTLEKVSDKGNISFLLRRGKQPSEKAILLSPLDERDFGDPFSVAAGVFFPRYGLRFAALSAISSFETAPYDQVVVFGNSEQDLEKFIEKW